MFKNLLTDIKAVSRWDVYLFLIFVVIIMAIAMGYVNIHVRH
jgi:hypothetical protein